KSPGFEGFQLLRPTGENNQYFVYTQWASREDFENWRSSRDSAAAHASEDGTPRQPVATGAELLEFDIVELLVALEGKILPVVIHVDPVLHLRAAEVQQIIDELPQL